MIRVPNHYLSDNPTIAFVPAYIAGTLENILKDNGLSFETGNRLIPEGTTKPEKVPAFRFSPDDEVMPPKFHAVTIRTQLKQEAYEWLYWDYMSASPEEQERYKTGKAIYLK